MKTPVIFTLVFTALSAVLSGCGGQAAPAGMPKLLPCEVNVTQEGKPFAGAVVTFAPEDSSPWNASGNTDESGTAKMFTQGRYPGAAAGKYKVTLRKELLEKAGTVEIDGRAEAAVQTFCLVEAKYRDSVSTPLEIEVKAGQKSYPLDAGKAVREKDSEKK